MTAATTSAINYREHLTSGRLGTQASQVLDFVKQLAPGQDVSRLELADAMGMRLSSVCGRVNELIAAGLLEPAPNRACRVSGKTVCPVKAKPEQEILQ